MLKPIISSDSQMSEPPNTYIDHIDKKFKDRAPRMIYDEKLGDIFQIEGSKTRIPVSFQRLYEH